MGVLKGCLPLLGPIRFDLILYGESVTNHILVVRNEIEALRCKKKYPTLLAGVPLFFPDEERVSIRRRVINTVYHSASISRNSHVLKNFPQCDGFVALSV